jgi:hypothetical protein
MEKLSRARTAAVGTMVVLAGVFAAPQAAHAYGINKCEERWNINQTQHTVRCNGSFLDSDLYGRSSSVTAARPRAAIARRRSSVAGVSG